MTGPGSRAALGVLLAVASLGAWAQGAAPVPANTDPRAATTGRAWASADTVFLEELTWTELRERIRAGDRTAIIPVGGTEQNGPHMALGKHNLRVRILAERIARLLGHALVFPVVAYVPEGDIDPPTSHMRFPGTLSIPVAAFESVLDATGRSARRHGFTRIVVLGEHGGYQDSLRRVEARFNADRRNTPARMFAARAYYASAQEGFAAELARGGIRHEEIGTHAGMLDTSLSLALAPALVRADRMAAPPDPALGTYGDPRRASAAWGEKGAARIVEDTVRSIRSAF